MRRERWLDYSQRLSSHAAKATMSMIQEGSLARRALQVRSCACLRNFHFSSALIYYVFTDAAVSQARAPPYSARCVWPTWLERTFLTLGLWFNPQERHYFHTGLVSHWIGLEYWTNKRTRGLPVSFHQGGGFFCSCLGYEILFVVVGVFCKMDVVATWVTWLYTLDVFSCA